MAFKKPKYSPWCTITREPHSTDNDFCEEYGADKIKDQKETEITPHQSFLATSTLHPNALSLPQTREQFSKIPANAKIYDLGDSGSSGGEQFSKVSWKTANDMRIKGFLKNEDGKKHNRGSILNNIFFIFYNLIIFRKSSDKLISRNVS